MTPGFWRSRCVAGCAGLVLLAGAASASDTVPGGTTPATQAGTTSASLPEDIRKNLQVQGERLDAMRSQIEAQTAQIERLKHELSAQEASYRDLRRAAGALELGKLRGGREPGASTDTSVARADVVERPVGRAPAQTTAPPAVAPIFSQPGVLTPRHKFVIEPSYQFGYSSASRVDLIGYTVIPAILVGLIDARQVKTTTQTAAIALRYGLTNRLELELRVPYLYNHTDTISREIFTGSAEDRVFTSSGHGIGDVEATVRYQMNDGGADRPYYIGWLRVKSRTGRDPFEVTTDCVTRCVQNATGTGLPLQVPTGSGFYSVQPGLTWLYPSDPVVFFGNLSYLHNIPRHGVYRTVLLGGREPLGKVALGDVVDVSIGMGFALNEKASISLGYDQSFVGITKQNDKTVAGSSKSVLGTLLIGGSYRMSDKRTLNIALGVGVTRDTPDATITVRLPMTY